MLYSKDGGSNNVRATFKTHDEFYQSPLSFRYEKGIYIITTLDQDLAMKAYGDKFYSTTYDPFSNNCGDLVNEILSSAGINRHKTFGISIPSTQYNDFSSRPNWSDFWMHPKPPRSFTDEDISWIFDRLE